MNVNSLLSRSRRWLPGILGIAVLSTGAATWPVWGPRLSTWIEETIRSWRTRAGSVAEHEHDDHGEHGTRMWGTKSIELTPQARRNLGLTDEELKPIQLSTYRRTIGLPAMVVPRPGRTHLKVSAPLTGVVTHVHAVTGEAVVPGSLLFELRLTHEDLVQSQTEFLKTLGELEVENKEVARLRGVADQGGVSGRILLERQYAKEKLEAILKAQRETLRLHGLSDRQIDRIAADRQLLRDLVIVAPTVDEHAENEELRLSGEAMERVAFDIPPAKEDSTPLVVERLSVVKGQSVLAGDELCSVADYSRLFLEGQAFEQDLAAVTSAVTLGLPFEALLSDGTSIAPAGGLSLAYLSNSVDPESRSLSVFVQLTNRILSDRTNAEGQRFLTWEYRVGQRMQLRVAVEEWADQIVLPADAVVQDGPEWFVFRRTGRMFTQLGVHVKYRDPTQVVIAHDGTLYPGDVVARRSAHQLLMAIKNQSGGGVDPHAGHNH